MRAALVLLLVVATAACGAYRFPGENGAGNGTVSGQVTAVPCVVIQPVPPAGPKPAMQPCTARPVPGIEIDFSGNGTTVSTRTDPKGFYAVELSAGTWKVSFNGYMRILSGPRTVTVSEGARVIANYLVDSGIRYPVANEPPTKLQPPQGAPAPG